MIDLQARDETGRILAQGCGLEWTQELIDLEQTAFPMLTGLCAFLDTVFNQRQIPLLLAELHRLPAGVIPEPARADIRRLAAVVQEQTHRYLWFVGD